MTFLLAQKIILEGLFGFGKEGNVSLYHTNKVVTFNQKEKVENKYEIKFFFCSFNNYDI